MADAAVQRNLTVSTLRLSWARQWGPVVLTLGVLLITITLALRLQNLSTDSALLVESTPGQLGIWMAGQSGKEAPQSILGKYAKDWAVRLGQETLDEATVLNTMRVGLTIVAWGIVAFCVIGLVGLVLSMWWARTALLIVLIGLDLLLLTLPVLEGENLIALILLGIFMLLMVLLIAPGSLNKAIGMVGVFSALLLSWETFKGFAASVNYDITVPQSNWTHITYETLEQTLDALDNGEIVAVIGDRNDLEDLMAPAVRRSGGTPIDPASTQYPNLRLLTGLNTATYILGLPIIPAFPGRLNIAVRAEDASRWTSVNDLIGQPVGALQGDFADERFLAVPRELVLVNLNIGNDLNLPHLQEISESMLQPTRRDGPFLLARTLTDAILFTWLESALGFLTGALLGFMLGTLFAHSRLMERGLLPYVVMSQTVPILALAPMVVIWLRDIPDKRVPVAIIATYLTFFPVTINTLRGLQSPHPNALELMQSYAASKWTIMWKLRFPSALPYIFTALKVSATASVVGAIIGELPSGVVHGLGGLILNFNQYYVTDPSRLWGAIIAAAMLGIGFFLVVVIAERLILPKTMQSN